MDSIKFLLFPLRAFGVAESRLFMLVILPAVLILGGCEARQDGTPISRSQDLALNQKVYREFLTQLKPSDLEHLRSSRKNMLDFALDLHSDAATAAEAETSGLDRDPEVAARLDRARREILSRAMLSRAMQAVKIPTGAELEELAREKYLAAPKNYATPERRRVAHILLRPIEHCPCQVETPEETARKLTARLETGADFAELAREYSKDSRTAENGGEVPAWIQRDGKTVPDFENAVFALKEVGQISDPIQTPFGVDLIRLLAIDEARIPPFDELREGIEKQIINEIRFNAAKTLRSENYPDPNSIDFTAIQALIDETLAEKARNDPQTMENTEVQKNETEVAPSTPEADKDNKSNSRASIGDQKT